MYEHSRQEEVTRLLEQLGGGSEAALRQLLPILYDELRMLARAQLRHERSGHTLDTAALVHEAYLKLVRLDRIQWKNRAQFFALAAQAMRRILVNYAEQRRALKRGGGRAPVDLDEAALERAALEGAELMTDAQAEDVLALDEAMERLRACSERQHQIVACRFFAGLSIEETAAALDVSPATVKRDWTLARAFLNREMRPAS